MASGSLARRNSTNSFLTAPSQAQRLWESLWPVDIRENVSVRLVAASRRTVRRVSSCLCSGAGRVSMASTTRRTESCACGQGTSSPGQGTAGGGEEVSEPEDEEADEE